MRAIERTTICVVLTIAPFVGIGCMLNRSGPPQLTRKEPKIFAVQRDKPLLAQNDTKKNVAPSDQSAKTETPEAKAEIASDDRPSTPSKKDDGKSSSAKTAARIKKSENESAVAATSAESKQESKTSSTPSASNDVSSPIDNTLVQISTVIPTQYTDESENKLEPSQVKLAGHEDSSDEIEFEVPKPVSTPATKPEESERAWDAPDDDEIEETNESSTSSKADEWNSPGGFEVQTEKVEECDFQQFCLVKFKEERVFTPGLPEFTMEYRAQRFRLSSAEAAEKFQADPERFAPTAGGLDIVSFRNNQEIIQGSLDFAVWYKQRLYLFSNFENVKSFQRQPEEFAATE
jgi:YHS domain-containing protein